MRTWRLDPVDPATLPPSRRDLDRPPDDATIIDPDARIVDATSGDTVLLHVHLPPTAVPLAEAIANALQGVDWQGNKPNSQEFRLSGIKNAHQTFGYSAPVPLRRRYGASRTSFDRAHPEVGAALERLGAEVWSALEVYEPGIAESHRATVSTIRDDWMLADGNAPWTSGIVNHTAALPYHVDSGNLHGSWSAMTVLRRRVGGGLLHVPSYDVYLACPHRSVVLFDGARVLHGVTPLAIRDGGPAFRYSIVWYAKASIANAVDPADEIKRAQRIATEHEEART